MIENLIEQFAKHEGVSIDAIEWYSWPQAEDCHGVISSGQVLAFRNVTNNNTRAFARGQWVRWRGEFLDRV